VLRQVERQTRAAVGSGLEGHGLDRAAHRIPQLGLPAADAEGAGGLSAAQKKVDVGVGVAPVGVLERAFEVGRELQRLQRVGHACGGRGGLSPQRGGQALDLVIAAALAGHARGSARTENDRRACLPQLGDLAQHGRGGALVVEIDREQAVAHAVGQRDPAVLDRCAREQHLVVEDVVPVAGRQRERGVGVPVGGVASPVLIRQVAHIRRDVGHEKAALQQVLTAAEVSDEGRGLFKPGDVGIDVRAGEVLDAGLAEGLGRAGEGVPDQMVDAVDEALVAAALEDRGVGGPVAHHVGEGFGRREPASVDVRGDGLRAAELPAAPVVRAGVPEFALRHVVDAEERELVGLAENGRRAVPRSARLGVPLNAVLMREAHHGAVEVVEEALVTRAAVVGHETRSLFVALHAEARQHRHPGTHGIAAELLEVRLERGRPGGHGALPAHIVEVGEGFAGERSDVVQKCLAHAVEVALDSPGVEDVHVILVSVDHGVAEAQQCGAGAVGQAAVQQGRFVGRRERPGEFLDLHGRADRRVRRVADALAGPAVKRTVARVAPLGGGQLGARVADLESRHVLEVGEWGGLRKQLRSAGAQRQELVDQSLGRIRADRPGAFERARATAQVHADGEPEPSSLAHRVRGHGAPGVAHERHFRLGIDEVVDVFVIAARVEKQQAAEADAPHGLQVARDGLGVHVAVDPPVIAPGPLRHRHVTEPLLQRVGATA